MASTLTGAPGIVIWDVEPIARSVSFGTTTPVIDRCETRFINHELDIKVLMTTTIIESEVEIQSTFHALQPTLVITELLR